MKNNFQKILMPFFLFAFIASANAQYTMPIETSEHEGTWLQWPHNYLYGPFYKSDLEMTWVEMTRELVKGENVHIIAYDETERTYIEQILTDNGVSLDKVDFYIHKTDDCWVRDNGPIFVFDQANEMALLDWGFNGWGDDTPFEFCDIIPQSLSSEIDIPSIDLNNIVLEGGAFEIDGNGSFMATKSSTLGADRNPGLSQSEMENYLTEHLGVTNFIWLEGVPGLEITDMHIDGFARFHDDKTIVCMDSSDLVYWEVPPADISTLFSAKNKDGEAYEYIFLPLSQNNVVTTWGENLGYRGSYVNYYVGNAVVLVPAYNDPNDEVAISILENIYPNREVVGIDVRNLYSGGGMVHCVTQQQPVNQVVNSTFEKHKTTLESFEVRPNPISEETTLEFSLKSNGRVKIELYDSSGQLVSLLVNQNLNVGRHTFLFENTNLKSGIYFCALSFNDEKIMTQKVVAP